MLNIPRANLNNYYDEMHTDKRPSKGVFFGVKTIILLSLLSKDVKTDINTLYNVYNKTS